MDSDYNSACVSLKRDLRASMRKHREAWCPECSCEVEASAVTGITQELFQLILDSDTKNPSVSEIICEADGSAMSGIERRI